jgi:uncharacterized protein (DUF427 family)
MTAARKLRNPHHLVEVAHDDAHIEVVFRGEKIAETRRGLVIDETGLSLRYYVPREDVNMEFLERTPRETFCPYKGGANYYTVRVGEHELRNRAWTYETPFDDTVALTGAIAFYQERLEVYVDGERV